MVVIPDINPPTHPFLMPRFFPGNSRPYVQGLLMDMLGENVAFVGRLSPFLSHDKNPGQSLESSLIPFAARFNFAGLAEDLSFS